MSYYIDLHIHSRFSRATSKKIDIELLSTWGTKKGLHLLGTGDLTHPGWLKELEEVLTLGDDGFYGFKKHPQGPRFIPTGEISCIYKQDGITRKIHLLVVAPNLNSAKKLSKTLETLGNIHSDGRPILGLTAKNLLEVCLTVDPNIIMIPAHIWTPWFSLFGSKSGFDDLEECFADLSPHITALETGLSSDPPMNRLVSALDNRVLVSFSDAHSADKLAREATVISGPLNFLSLKKALKGEGGLLGTLEFFPEEGKYHLDGHANCKVVLTPQETKALNGICPKCNKPLTIGVLSRVLQLADRTTPPDNIAPFNQLVPLMEVLSQIFKVGPKSLRVSRAYEGLIQKFSNELNIILKTSIDDLRDFSSPLLALAIERIRKAKVIVQGGYDGVFGTVEVISSKEQNEMHGKGSLFEKIKKNT